MFGHETIGRRKLGMLTKKRKNVMEQKLYTNLTPTMLVAEHFVII